MTDMEKASTVIILIVACLVFIVIWLDNRLMKLENRMVDVESQLRNINPPPDELHQTPS